MRRAFDAIEHRSGSSVSTGIGVAHGPCVFNIEQQTLLRRG
jgi:hypothetical protein